LEDAVICLTLGTFYMKLAETFRDEALNHLTNELLPFWFDRIKDSENGGYITHFDQDGNDTGEDEKSLIAQSRSLYTMASAHRAGYGDGQCKELARHGFEFLIEKIWDDQNGGFFWTVDRKGNVKIDEKIIYGLSFCIYSLSEYTLATGDIRGMEYAVKTFDLLQEHCYDTELGGYYEMFDRAWNLKGPGSKGGDRKTLDVHMHLMEAFTTLYECTGKEEHKLKLQENIDLLINKILHPVYKTGVPQFWPDWQVAPQIKFDIIWGWDRYTDGGEKQNADDNTCYGHNAEFAWLLTHALNISGIDLKSYRDLLKTIYDHTVDNGIDTEFGGIYVEGPHSGGVYDREKEFWQQAEGMIGLLDAYLILGDKKYWEAYKHVHRFVFNKVINHPVGEWWPLLTREGEPIWTHMSHSWKINYHSVRGTIQSINRLNRIINQDT